MITSDQKAEEISAIYTDLVAINTVTLPTFNYFEKNILLTSEINMNNLLDMRMLYNYICLVVKYGAKIIISGENGFTIRLEWSIDYD